MQKSQEEKKLHLKKESSGVYRIPIGTESAIIEDCMILSLLLNPELRKLKILASNIGEIDYNENLSELSIEDSGISTLFPLPTKLKYFNVKHSMDKTYFF